MHMQNRWRRPERGARVDRNLQEMGIGSSIVEYGYYLTA